MQGTPAEVTDLLVTVNETAGSDVPHSEPEEARSGQLGLGLRLEPPEDNENNNEVWRLTFWAENKEEGNSGFPPNRSGVVKNESLRYGVNAIAISSSSCL